MKKNQLTRALRIDKFTVAALELVLQEYLSEEKAIQNLPVLRMITESKAECGKACKISEADSAECTACCNDRDGTV